MSRSAKNDTTISVAGQNFERVRFDSLPNAVKCRGCGKAYFAASLKIHKRSCEFEKKRLNSLKKQQEEAKLTREQVAIKKNETTTETRIIDDSVTPSAKKFEIREDDSGRVCCCHCGRFFSKDRQMQHQSICGRLRQARSDLKPTQLYDSKKARMNGIKAPDAPIAYLFDRSLGSRPVSRLSKSREHRQSTFRQTKSSHGRPKTSDTSNSNSYYNRPKTTGGQQSNSSTSSSLLSNHHNQQYPEISSTISKNRNKQQKQQYILKNERDGRFNEKVVEEKNENESLYQYQNRRKNKILLRSNTLSWNDLAEKQRKQSNRIYGKNNTVIHHPSNINTNLLSSSSENKAEEHEEQIYEEIKQQPPKIIKGRPGKRQNKKRIIIEKVEVVDVAKIDYVRNSGSSGGGEQNQRLRKDKGKGQRRKDEVQDVVQDEVWNTASQSFDYIKIHDKDEHGEEDDGGVPVSVSKNSFSSRNKLQTTSIQKQMNENINFEAHSPISFHGKNNYKSNVTSTSKLMSSDDLIATQISSKIITSDTPVVILDDHHDSSRRQYNKSINTIRSHHPQNTNINTDNHPKQQSIPEISYHTQAKKDIDKKMNINEKKSQIRSQFDKITINSHHQQTDSLKKEEEEEELMIPTVPTVNGLHHVKGNDTSSNEKLKNKKRNKKRGSLEPHKINEETHLSSTSSSTSEKLQHQKNRQSTLSQRGDKDKSPHLKDIHKDMRKTKEKSSNVPYHVTAAATSSKSSSSSLNQNLSSYIYQGSFRPIRSQRPRTSQNSNKTFSSSSAHGLFHLPNRHPINPSLQSKQSKPRESSSSSSRQEQLFDALSNLDQKKNNPHQGQVQGRVKTSDMRSFEQPSWDHLLLPPQVLPPSQTQVSHQFDDSLKAENRQRYHSKLTNNNVEYSIRQTNKQSDDMTVLSSTFHSPLIQHPSTTQSHSFIDSPIENIQKQKVIGSPNHQFKQDMSSPTSFCSGSSWGGWNNS